MRISYQLDYIMYIWYTIVGHKADFHIVRSSISELVIYLHKEYLGSLQSYHIVLINSSDSLRSEVLNG